MKEITVQELKKLRDDKTDFFLLDVRDSFEYDNCNLGGYLIPLAELPQRIDELDPEKFTIVHCKMGGRSSRAVEFLQQRGFTHVFNLHGGLQAWLNEIEPSLSKR